MCIFVREYAMKTIYRFYGNCVCIKQNFAVVDAHLLPVMSGSLFCDSIQHVNRNNIYYIIDTFIKFRIRCVRKVAAKSNLNGKALNEFSFIKV